MEVLGYVGGALVLGAVIMLGSLFWDDLGVRAEARCCRITDRARPRRAALIKGESDRSSVGSCLHWPTPLASPTWLSSKIKFVVSAAVVVLTSAIGAVLLRSGAFLVSGWSGAMLLVCAVVFNVIDVAARTRITGWCRSTWRWISAGWPGPRRERSAAESHLAWSLAGLSGWAASIVLQMDAPNGEWLSLVVATLVSAALLTAFVLTRRYLQRGDRLRDLAEHLAGVAVPDP